MSSANEKTTKTTTDRQFERAEKRGKTIATWIAVVASSISLVGGIFTGAIVERYGIFAEMQQAQTDFYRQQSDWQHQFMIEQHAFREVHVGELHELNRRVDRYHPPENPDAE